MTRSSRKYAVLACLALGIGLVLPAAAGASVAIHSFGALPSTTAAGSHPDFSFAFHVSSRQYDTNPCACKDAEEVIAHLPAGLIGNPHAVSRCSIADFASDRCPVDSQLGIAEAAVDSTPEAGNAGTFIAPVFNLVPPPEEAGLIGFKTAIFDSPIFEVVSARTGGDYGLDIVTHGINHALPLDEFIQETWGVPASPRHDPLRFAFAQAPIVGITIGGSHPVLLCDAEGNHRTDDPNTAEQMCGVSAFPPGAVGEYKVGVPAENGPGYPIPSQSSETPFTQNATTCGSSSLESTLDVLSFDGGVSHASSAWPPTTDCGALEFEPSLFARPTSMETDSPSGIDVDLKAPIFESPNAPSPSEIRSTVVTLPPGFTINSGAADGKTSCLDAEARFGTTLEAHCPEFAKLGTLEVHSPVLPGVLPGAIYIGHPEAGERYRLFLAFDGFGVHVKLPGTVHPDPQTGQLVTEFRNLPQFPFEDFNLHFFGAERGILATPTQCGTYPVTTEFEPWDGALPNRTSTQFFTLSSGPDGSPCPNGPRPFGPSFQAASTSNTAGAHTAFSLDLVRRDGEQNLTALNVTTPPGFSATLKGVPYCPEADIAAAMAPGYSGLLEQEHSSCPAASLVGEAFAGAGVGTHPFYAPGKVYLAGPYKGAPLSLVVITPAVSGPYDLGDVVVRTALRVNPETAQVTAVSDPLPQILEGVPLRLRSILVELNRPNFALNPTNCEPLSTTAQVSGNEGATANLSSPFQVASCARLPFAPKIAVKLIGSTKRAAHPALRAVLSAGPGEANLARVVTTLSHSEFLDQGHLNNICTRVEFAANECPAASIYGHAQAFSPLVDYPVEGPVYLRSSSHKLPDLVMALRGPASQPIEIDVVGRIDSVNGQIRNSFETIPDLPVSRFTLEMQGGAKGLLVNSENLCAKPHFDSNLVSAQNGRSADQRNKLQTSCGAKGHKRARLGRASVAR